MSSIRYLSGRGCDHRFAGCPSLNGDEDVIDYTVRMRRFPQDGPEEQGRAEVLNDFSTYLNLAESYTHLCAPALIITYGLSGSGKSTKTFRCLEALSAVRLRSDVVRKQLAKMSAWERSESG